MCGICGIASADPAFLVSGSELAAMTDALVHRGPDDAGRHIAPGVALGSRRLAILDLSERGHMPMGTADGRYWITYNGEVYNHQELRPGLEARGYAFRSRTDTEVLLYLYAEEGPSMLDRLNGMFALAIWDSRERTLFLARDRLGIKPLYYACKGGALYFASEEKALFAAGIPAEFDPDTWEELLCFRYVAGERTPFAGVTRLLPGHYLVWKQGSIRTRRWWRLAERVRARRENLPRDPCGWFQETFDDAVRLRRISDVPVGVLLSGGLDSGSVAASLASQGGSGAASFTVRFAESEYDEGPLAREVAERWHLEPHELHVEPEQLFPLLKTASWLNGAPLAHASDPHLFALSRYAKERVTVLLSGEGADETLGGYVRYQPLRYPGLMKAARPLLPLVASALHLNGRWRKLNEFLALNSLDRFVLFNACDTLPAALTRLGMDPTERFPFREAILAEAKTLYPAQPVRQAMFSDLHTFLCSLLDRNDRMTMGASVECRVPFLDYRLVEMLAALPSAVLFSRHQSKSLLRRAVGGRLPEAVQRHRKRGFAVPWTAYVRRDGELRDWVGALPDLDLIREGPFDRSRLRTMVNESLGCDPANDMLLCQLVMITVWHEACMFSRPRQQVVLNLSQAPVAG